MNTLPLDFQLFEGRRTRSGSAPALGIQKRGNFSLNAAAFELLGEPEAVHLYFSPSTNIIGVKPVSKDTPQSYPVRKQQNARSWLVGARSFLNGYGVPYEEQETVPSFAVTLVQGIGVVDLKEHPAMVPSDSHGE